MYQCAALVRFWNHACDFNPNCTSLSSNTSINKIPADKPLAYYKHRIVNMWCLCAMIKQLKKVTDHLLKKKCCREDLASMIDGKNNSQSWEGKGYAVIWHRHTRIKQTNPIATNRIRTQDNPISVSNAPCITELKETVWKGASRQLSSCILQL